MSCIPGAGAWVWRESTGTELPTRRATRSLARPLLQVGSDDFDVRVFQNEDVIAEASEADQFVGLCAIYGPKFGYALVNGTIGALGRACA